ncbi:MAG: GTP-binding protein, partial [Chloroflexi bacterium]|nr:GTP-binding protein [Chloroflexota bacterium]
MKDYAVERMRNVVLLGHGSSGKTSLSEAILFDAGAISRLGRVEDKNTTSDYDEEEQLRGFSVNCSVLPFEWRDCKVNLLDAPGYLDFVGEVKAAIRAADAGVLVICAASGVEVGAELHWRFLEEEKRPRLVFVNKMDRDNASFERALEALRTKFDARFVPIQLPIGAQAAFRGVVDLIEMKAYLADGQEAEVPPEMRAAAEAARTEMMEFAAEVDDELMLKYLDGEELTNDEIRRALAEGSARGEFVLVLAGSATKNIAIRQLLDAIVAYLPDPTRVPRTAVDLATNEEVVLSADAAGPLVVQVFKTLADPFVGKLSYLRVYSGTLYSDSRVWNSRANEEERIGQLYMVRGKEQTPVPTLKAGDI